MIEEDAIPLPFLQRGWTTDFSECRITSDNAWRYLHANTSSVRQAHRGWALKEEGYVKNLKLNVNTSDPTLGIIRATCTPSMKSGIYVPQQDMRGRRWPSAELADDKGMEVACTDLPCKWIVPAEGVAQMYHLHMTPP
ncbi:hypothetical protein HPB49_016041 [Dermacentor silvarum]|uniref:Uncharacterized protein n=1 Tax=Dermacentor silvarum TaxID=543639 RepID=A0ACB8CLW1_DERSI|nr:hypothetical protein HPB49_016041 [Dermacentor silvarum]